MSKKIIKLPTHHSDQLLPTPTKKIPAFSIKGLAPSSRITAFNLTIEPKANRLLLEGPALPSRTAALKLNSCQLSVFFDFSNNKSLPLALITFIHRFSLTHLF
jgi:hypothetical protein